MLTGSSTIVKNTTYRASVLPDGRWILFEPTSNTVAVLSSSAGVFWELCTGELPMAAVIKEIASLYPDRDTQEITTDAFDVARDMLARDLVAVRDS
jgi:hypothetical protein